MCFGKKKSDPAPPPVPKPAVEEVKDETGPQQDRPSYMRYAIAQSGPATSGTGTSLGAELGGTGSTGVV